MNNEVQTNRISQSVRVILKSFTFRVHVHEMHSLGRRLPTLIKIWSRINVTSWLNIWKIVRKAELKSWSILF